MFSKRRKQIVLTFDDGYQDFLTNVLPVLLRHRLPATVFIVTNMLGQTATWNDNAPLMAEEDVRKVHAHGISIGSHTLTHVNLTTLEERELQQQLVTSRMALADLGEAFFSFSYPWGKYTNREVAAVRAAGYECAVAVGKTTRFSRADSYRLGRLVMHRDLNIDSFRCMIIGSGLPQWVLARARTLTRRVMKRVFLRS